VPDSDLFAAIRSGKASVVTDQIDHFTATGIALASGKQLDADIIVTATGLNLVVLGEMKFAADGAPIDFAQTWTYKGMMYSGVPNLVSTFGYINASWTLRADLTCEYVCRLLNHMDAEGQAFCTPRAPEGAEGLEPFIGLSSGYVQRSVGSLPKQGPRAPWRLYQNYIRDVRMFRHGDVEDEAIEFTPRKAGKRSVEVAA
jgi:cation diffusion facilitator CzcD-associated flavoprotein CzcO